MAAQLIVIILLTTLCFVAQVSTIGDFYQPSRGNREETLSLSNSNKRIRKSLKEPVDMYGTKYADIYIYLDGLVGFSADDLLQKSCPYRPTNETPEKFIAPYWLRNTQGTVRYFEETKQGGLMPHANELAAEINAAFDERPVRAEEITYAVFISWNNMMNSANFESRERRSSFQTVLVNANGKTYVHFIYRVLGSYSVQSLNGADQECQENAVIGINAGVDYRFDLSGFFFFRRDWVVYFTNERDYQRLGRYVFGLYRNIDRQPLPPRLNCIGDMPEPFCKVAVWDSVKDAIDEEFCKYRSSGMYPYPLSCDHFVHCFGKRAFVQRCLPGLHYNPILSVCDWKEHVECKLPSNVIITTHHNRTMAPPAPSRHQNFCASRRNGIFADPMTCDHYFSCSNTQTIVRECPGALYFQVTTEGDGFCDHKYNVKCKNGIRTILNAANAQKTIQATSNIQVPEVIRVLPTTNSIESSKHTEEQSSNIEAPNTTKKLNKIEESVNTIDSNNIEPSDNTEESNTVQLVVTTEESNNIESTNNIEETSSTETSDNNV